MVFCGDGLLYSGVPTIEFYDPNKHPKQQIPEGDAYTTIYRKLGLVHAANNEDIENAVTRLMKNNHETQLKKLGSFFIDVMNRPINWEKSLRKYYLLTIY